jgi:putative spermidine/putrescine transport system permease protein
VAKAMKRKLNLPLTITLILLSLFVFIPMISAFEFSLRTPGKGGYGWDQYLWAIREEDFLYYIIRSGWLAALTVVITLVVLVPTMTWLHLSKSSIRPFVDGISLLPLVIPVVAFAVGAQISFPEFVQNTVLELPFLYFVLALPYAYRTLDIGLNSIPLKTLTEAARSAGANWWRTIITVIIPVIKSAVVGTVAITFALSLGEYTLTVLLHWDTFPTWVTFVAQENILGAIAISMMSLVIPFLVLTAVTLVSPERSTQGRK